MQPKVAQALVKVRLPVGWAPRNNKRHRTCNRTLRRCKRVILTTILRCSHKKTVRWNIYWKDAQTHVNLWTRLKTKRRHLLNNQKYALTWDLPSRRTVITSTDAKLLPTSSSPLAILFTYGQAIRRISVTLESIPHANSLFWKIQELPFELEEAFVRLHVHEN